MSAADPAGSCDLPAVLAQRLHAGPGDWVALEDFAPLPQCLEWRLSRAYWNQRGSAAFYGGDVPYAAINDGRLSCDVARFLAELCDRDPARAPRVLEVGGGSGLFARLLLDELAALAPELHAATRYVWTDGAPAMVEQLRNDGVLARHAAQVQSMALQLPEMSGLGEAAEGGFDLIVANYAVDNLPATMLRLRPDSVEEMELRATLDRSLAPSRLGGRPADDWAQALRRGQASEAEAIELYPWFSLDCRYRQRPRDSLPLGHLLPEPDAGQTFHWLHHEAAWRWLQAALPLLRPGGVLLVDDYGYRPSAGGARHEAFQHFGPSLANGLNLDELERFVASQPGFELVAPPSDSRQVSSRLIVRTGDALAAGLFKLVFDGARRDTALVLLDQAEQAAGARRLEEARWLFWKAHEAAPRCWHVAEHWAGFVHSRLKDQDSAIGLARQGLALHPRHPRLWNLLGDALYERGDPTEAEAAYRAALGASPRDVRARLNLAFVEQDRGRFREALLLLAEALALDAQGEWRDSVLEKQRQVLLAQTLAQRDAIVQQMNRFRNLDAPLL